MISKKGQAAMEFLMTYGWAILVVLIAIGALAYFGILSPSAFFPEKCTLESGMACTDLVVGEDGVQVQLTNGFGNDITVREVRVISAELGINCYNTNDLLVENGAAADFTIPACNLSAIGDGKNKYNLEVKYTKQGSSFVHTMEGEVLAEVEDEDFFVPGSAIKLDGSTGYVVLDNQPSLTEGFTFSAWAKRTADVRGSIFNNNQFFLRSQIESEDPNNPWEAFVNLGGSLEPRVKSFVPAVVDQWFFITVTWDKVNLKIYIDGELKGTEGRSGSLTSTTAEPDIGRGEQTTSNTAYFGGDIDEVRFYTKILTDKEISDLYNSGAGNYGGVEPGLVAGYHFDGDADDFSGNNNFGTPSGITSYVEGIVDKP